MVFYIAIQGGEEDAAALAPVCGFAAFRGGRFSQAMSDDELKILPKVLVGHAP